jgi:hypothetical protein
VTFPSLVGEESIQTFWRETCRELYRRTTLTEVQEREMTDKVLENIMWEEPRPWEERWETLKVDESRVEEQEVDDEERQSRFWRHRPVEFTVNEKEHVIYVLEFKRVSDTGEKYMSETQKLTEIQHLTITQDLKKTVQRHTMDS